MKNKKAISAVDLALSLVVIGALAVVISLFVFSVKNKSLKKQRVITPNSQISPSPLAFPTATPRPLSLHGNQPFSISSDSREVGPRIGIGEIRPIDPEINGLQELDIDIDNKGQDVQEVTIELRTNSKKVTHPLTLLKGTAKVGTWHGSWKMTDEYLSNYQIAINAKGANGSSQVVLTLR